MRYAAVIREALDGISSFADEVGPAYAALDVLVAENERLRDALNDILNPRVGPTGGLSRSHGGTGFPVEIARAALAAPTEEQP